MRRAWDFSHCVPSNRSIALAALAHYAIDSPRLRLLHDGYNVTFEVRDVHNNRYALRITRASTSLAHVRSEVAWTDALACDTSIRVLEVVRTKNGAPSARCGDCVVLVSRWLPGRQFSKVLSTRMLRAVGTTMALLHRHGRDWKPPQDWSRPRLDVTWLHDAPDPIPGLPTMHQSVFREAHSKLVPLLRTLVSEASHVLHADLHQGNYRFAPGFDVGVIDFDDMAVGHPAQDIAISLYYLARYSNGDELIAAFRSGYKELEPWPLDRERLDALLVWRALGLCASVMAHENPKLRKRGLALLPKWALQCERWLKV